MTIGYACSDKRTDWVRRTDMTCLFSATPHGGAHQALLEMRGSPSCALGVIIMKGTESTDRPRSANADARRTHTHTSTHTSTTTACMSAHEHTLTKGNQSMTIGSCHFRQRQVGEECSSNEVPWGENFLLFPGSDAAVQTNSKLTQGWMPSDRSNLVHMNTCLHYQHTSNKCAHLRTKTWWDLARDDPCADSMLEACKF